MSIAKFVAAGSMAFALIGSMSASADFRGEVHHSARECASRHRPVSEHDAELLERWGCLSGTRNPICERGNKGRRFIASVAIGAEILAGGDAQTSLLAVLDVCSGSGAVSTPRSLSSASRSTPRTSSRR